MLLSLKACILDRSSHGVSLQSISVVLIPENYMYLVTPITTFPTECTFTTNSYF